MMPLRYQTAAKFKHILLAEEEEMAKFRELYLAGKIEFEAIDDYSYKWGMSDDNDETLAQYLGLTPEEEDAWVSVSEDALRELLDKAKKA